MKKPRSPSIKKPLFAVSAALATVCPTAAADFSPVISQLKAAITEEMRSWEFDGLAIALVDDQRVIFAEGFGEAKRNSVFRVGSISKLFNAIAVMQQVEQGKLQLDVPLSAAVLPINPFPGNPPVTLRQILCHRSGLPREAPVGGYLDASQPTLHQTVVSARSTVLATVPGAKTRYSNLAPSIAGYLVEQASGQSFAAYQQDHLLGPLGMTHSAWSRSRAARSGLIVSHMRVADGRGGWRPRTAPLFDLGTVPAGNLFSTVEDLARFASALLAGGEGLLRPETWREMWQPQMTSEPIGFGLGFMVGKFRQHRTLGHNGAVYGFSASFTVLPEAKLAVIVLANEDLVTGSTKRISDTALSLLLEAKLGERPPPAQAAGAQDFTPLTGDYESESLWARLDLCNGQLSGQISGQFTRFDALDALHFTAHSRIEEGVPVTFERSPAGGISGFQFGLQRFTRVSPPPPSWPPAWRAFRGRYGPDFIPVIVTERYGHLYAMTENMLDYRLTPVNRQVCALPLGLYTDEQVIFQVNRRGQVQGINFAGMILPRRR